MKKFEEFSKIARDHTFRRKQLLNWIIALVAAISSILSIYIFTHSISPPKNGHITGLELQTYEELLENSSREFDSLMTVIQKKRAFLDSIRYIRAETVFVSLELNKVKNNLKTLYSRISILEDAIMENPMKALSIPMMKKDIEDLEGDQLKAELVIRTEISRLYDQNKWFMGLIITMTISLFGLAVGNLLPIRRVPAKRETESDGSDK